MKSLPVIGFIVFPILLSWYGIIVYADLATGWAIVHDSTIPPIIWFSIWQAFLSAFLSLLIALPASLYLWRFNPLGKSFFMNLFGVGFAIPTIAAVFAIIEIYGREGWFNQFFELIGWEEFGEIYGLKGILLAHLFFNVPYSIILITNGLSSIPSNYYLLAAQMKIKGWNFFRYIILPCIWANITSSFILVFLICLVSFATVYVLGGLRFTTMEMAIYEALKYDFDYSKAVILSFIQIIICAAVMFCSKIRGSILPEMTFTHYDKKFTVKTTNMIYYYGGGIFFILAIMITAVPVLSILIKILSGETYQIWLLDSFRHAFLWSFLISMLSSLICNICGLVLSDLYRKTRNQFFDYLAYTTLIFSPFVLGTGLFIMMNEQGILYSSGFWGVVWINSLVALPFTYRILKEPMMLSVGRYKNLAKMMGVKGLRYFFFIDLPFIKKPLIKSFCLAAALSMGDLSIIAIFGSEEVNTLPLLITRLMGHYRSDDAGSAVFWLCVLIFLIMYIPRKLNLTPDSRNA